MYGGGLTITTNKFISIYQFNPTLDVRWWIDKYNKTNSYLFINLTLLWMYGGGFHHPLKKLMIPQLVSHHFEYFETDIFFTPFSKL